MPSLKAIRKRISSVKNTQKITKAMKMVAAANLRRAQESVQAIRPYARRLSGIANDLAERLASEPLPETADSTAALAESEGGETPMAPEVPSATQIQRILLGQTERRIRLLVVSSDRGLAGAYNSGMFRLAERFITERKLKGDTTVEVVVLGKKGRDYLRRRPHKVVGDLGGVDRKTVAVRAKELAAQLTKALLSDQCDAVYVAYNEFKSAATPSVRVDRLMPLSVKTEPKAPSDEPQTLVDFIYEPGRPEVLLHLLPLYLETEIMRILLEAIAAEFGARMSAMDNASRNAKEMISRLTLQYNRARQAAITKELMEIVGGAEALKG